ncbi:hypothetical protein [Arachidicoccus soli]|nr:hypothetical protein [Arachidicoccus soli]
MKRKIMAFGASGRRSEQQLFTHNVGYRLFVFMDWCAGKNAYNPQVDYWN